MRVLVADGLESEAIAKLRAVHHVDVVEADPKQLLEIIPNYDALIVRSRTKVSAEVLAKASKLKVVGRAGIGVDNIDVKAATARRVPVVNAPTGSTISVAELALGHMLSLARQIPEADRTMKAGKWEKKRFEGRELHGKVLGLLGSGRIGAEVARRAQAFGMDVIAFDPYLPPPAAKERRIRLVDGLAALLMQADYLSIHAALTPETKGMIGAKELALMKRTAYVVNCARGDRARGRSGGRAHVRDDRGRGPRRVREGAAHRESNPRRPEHRIHAPSRGLYARGAGPRGRNHRGPGPQGPPR